MNTTPPYLALGIREKLYIGPGGELTPLFSGHQHCPPGHMYQGIREHYLLCCVKSGFGTFVVHSPQNVNAVQEYRMGPGDTFLIKPGQLTRYFADPQQPWAYAWIAFSGTTAASCIAGTDFSKTPVVHTGTGLYEQLVRLTESNILLPQTDTCRMYATGFLWNLLADLSRTVAQMLQTPATNHYVMTAVSIIRRKYDSALTVSDIASELGISREYFYTLFKSATGKSPSQYLLEYRIEQACRMLRESNYPAHLIAQHTGFKDMAYFSRQFRKSMGFSPSEYRRRNRTAASE